ncbi:13659_t:CDS:2, partial [Acaulospora colombiana]
TTHGSSQRRRLYKDKGRAHTAPVTFPFVVTPEAILNAAQPRPGEVEDNVLAEPPTIKPLEVVSLFETMLPQETKLLVMGQLVISHQEEFEQKVKEGKWSVAHAKGTRWVGKDAGMRELIKLTRVSKSWENITLDGQLWHSVDLKAFPGLSNTFLLKIARRAGSFVHTLSLQGYTHLKSSSVIHISSYFSINPQFNQNHLSASSTTQLTTINLVGCTSITTHSLHYLLLRSPRVKHLFLRGLDSVTNTTLTEIVGPRCRNLLTLDIRRCSNANGTGLMSFAEQCKERAVETDISCRLKTLKIANMKGTTADVMRLVGEAFPLLEVLDASYCKDLADEGFRALVEWPTPSPEIRSGLRQPEDWTRFSQGIEITSREAGFDPGDPTKYWRRITGLRHLNLSGCRHIGGGACSVLAYSVPKLEFLELAGVGGEVHDDGLIKLLQNAPLIRKLDLEDATEITDAVLDCLTPEVRTPATSTANGRRESREEGNSPQPGEMLEHFVISYAMSATPPSSSRSPPPTLITPPSTSFSVTNQHSMVMLSASPEGLSHYSPDVADLLHMPPYELERKAFDWDEFERSLRASPGAGTSSSVTPFLPIDSLSGGLGLMLASSSTGINHVDSLDSPEDFNVQIPGPSVAEGTENRDEPSSGAANT